jgi:hypothetical protein
LTGEASIAMMFRHLSMSSLISIAHRIAGFPAAGQFMVKDRVNAVALAPPEDFATTPISSAAPPPSRPLSV